MLMSRRMASPNGDVVGGANRLGIRLKSARYLRRSSSSTPRSGFGKRPPATPHGVPDPWDNNITEPNRRSTTPNGGRTAMYIHDVIVPLSGTSCEHQSRVSPFPRLNIHSPTAVSLPQMRNCTTPRPPSNTVKNMSTLIDKYLISTTAREDTILLGESRKRWNSSGQAIRFEAEQEERMRSRSVKKNSQSHPHRVDRLYYMCGTSLDIQERYYVDDEELQRVKDLSRARKKLTHYGKGLSKYKYSWSGVDESGIHESQSELELSLRKGRLQDPTEQKNPAMFKLMLQQRELASRQLQESCRHNTPVADLYHCSTEAQDSHGVLEMTEKLENQRKKRNIEFKKQIDSYLVRKSRTQLSELTTEHPYHRKTSGCAERPVVDFNPECNAEANLGALNNYRCYGSRALQHVMDKAWDLGGLYREKSNTSSQGVQGKMANPSFQRWLEFSQCGCRQVSDEKYQDMSLTGNALPVQKFPILNVFPKSAVPC